MPTEFLRPKFEGRRFDGHAIPLEVLKDLAVLEELVIEVAKAKFLEEHQDRKRTPKGFTEGIELRLVSVQEGSAIPVIVLSVAALTLPGVAPANQDYFERARDAIIQAIGAAEHEQPVTDLLPMSKLVYFDRLGRSLREGESIQFNTPVNTSGPRLTPQIRRTLVLADPSVREVTEEKVLRGSVPEADQERMTFTLQPILGSRVVARIPPAHLDTIRAAWIGYADGTRVSMRGTVRIDRAGQLKGVEEVEHISLLDPLDVAARLDEFRALRDGWKDGDGSAPPPEGLDWLSSAFGDGFPDDLLLPHTYPTPAGGVRFEWLLGATDVSLELDLSTRIGKWHALNLETDQETTHEVDLAEETGWQWLDRTLRGMAGDAS